MKQRNAWDYNEQKIILGQIPTDLYHWTQASTIFNENEYWRRAVHDYFFRKTPFGSYVLVAGVEWVLKNLYNMKFTEEDVNDIEAILKQIGSNVQDDFLEYLRKFNGRKFKGTVAAMPEGSIALPREPVIRITGEWLETWIIETMILKGMNYASLLATYASRAVTAARGIPIAGFGLRRAPGDGNAITAERSGYIGGFTSTSNVLAGRRLGIPLSGTMSHELVQGLTLIRESETEAFVVYGKNNPGNQIFLTDTFASPQGIRHAIEAAGILGRPSKAIREDSGDLIVKAKMARKMDKNKSGFGGISLSGDLDIEQIDQIAASGADIVFLGLGTKFVAPEETSALGGVFKLAALENNNGEMIPNLKISSDEVKITLPGEKEVWHEYSDGGKLIASRIALVEEGKPDGNFRKMLVEMMKDGKMLVEVRDLAEIRQFALGNVASLLEKNNRIKNPEPIPVAVSDSLGRLQKELIEKAKKI